SAFHWLFTAFHLTLRRKRNKLPRSDGTSVPAFGSRHHAPPVLVPRRKRHPATRIQGGSHTRRFRQVSPRGFLYYGPTRLRWLSRHRGMSLRPFFRVTRKP